MKSLNILSILIICTFFNNTNGMLTSQPDYNQDTIPTSPTLLSIEEQYKCENDLKAFHKIALLYLKTINEYKKICAEYNIESTNIIDLHKKGLLIIKKSEDQKQVHVVQRVRWQDNYVYLDLPF